MQAGRLSHAYIIAGPEAEAEEKARALAKAMLCSGPEASRPCGLCGNCRKVDRGSHPDLSWLRRLPDDKGKPRREIVVEQIRELSASAAVLPGEAERKVYIICEAGTMNPPAQNALLKLLEEPPRFVSLILCCESADLLLETVRSRCVLLHVRGADAPPPPEAREMAERWLDLAAQRARLSLISFANANGDKSVAELQEFTRAARELIADMACGRLPDRRMGRPRLMELYRLVDKTEEYLRFNVSPKHVLGMLSVETVQSDEGM